MSTLSVTTIKSKTALTPPAVQDLNGIGIGTFCRAWVNFNGSGTVAIRAAFNVTSITDNGVGLYTVNFTNALPDANYCVSTGTTQPVSGTTNFSGGFDDTTFSTTQLGLRIQSSVGADYDPSIVCLSVFR